MECRFLSNGLSIKYDQVVKPCCVFKSNAEWDQNNQLGATDLTNWHQSRQVQQLQEQLAQNIWPTECSYCANNNASVMADGASAYADYHEQDITLEIRPGSVCNFACQTCWPEASSRVRDYYRKAGLDKIIPIVSNSPDSFEFLLPIKHRIRDIVVLGGEPFYDKNCLRFFAWLSENAFASNLVIFTNGSHIDYDFVKHYPGMLKLVFSLDATGKPAEYIRYGTEWATVYSNFIKCREYANVQLRANITLSAYNYWYLNDLIALLSQDWPAVVDFGYVDNQTPMDESVIPMQFRQPIIDSLLASLQTLKSANIAAEQKLHVLTMIKTVIARLKTTPWHQDKFEQFKTYVQKMDTAKGVAIKDYCPEVARMLDAK